MIKTSIAVFFCMLIYRILGYQGGTMPVEAAITAIICMQPFISDSRTFAFNRISGTLVGAFWGMLFLLLMFRFPVLGKHHVILYVFMAVGVLISVYSSVALRIPDASGLAAIVFMCIVARYPDIEDPILEVARRFLGVMIGTSVAIVVNVVRLPREKNEDTVFFVRGKDLTPNRFAQVPAGVLFHMNRLHEDGAKICIVLEHAPALFTMQMSSCQLSVPLIVMDGAAIFDISKNRYISVTNIEREKSEWIRKFFAERQIGFFSYAVINNRTCVYHSGEMNELEIEILKRLQRSPYRSYLNGEEQNDHEVVYYKVIEQEEELKKLQSELEPLLREQGLRSVLRDQASSPGISGLYIYSAEATVENARTLLMELLQVSFGMELKPMNIFSRSERYSEREASMVLRRLMHAYEPLIFKKYFRKGN
ncbi:MAG: aromatic acid exporter family protein [Lachnospiraceae bacterium]|nr:aromatic acid exporter family protein [Lachnospiraceae bacterium]